MIENFEKLYLDKCIDYEDLEAEYNEYKGIFLIINYF